MSPATQVVLKLDLEHLTESEKDWLHILIRNVQERMLKKYIRDKKEKQCSKKLSFSAH